MCSWAERAARRAVRVLLLPVGLAATAILAAPAHAAGVATPAASEARPAARADGNRLHLGRPARPEEIAAWDIDVRPDGHGVKPGRGNVERGQQIYDVQCAHCHGTFGESNAYLALAGGVTPADLATGRAARLRDHTVQRTLGTKLNSAATLWDYIYRAMPWTNPLSLSVDETYAVTAYVLHLNDIVPADFELTDANLLSVPMPNRHGLTRNHGMGSVRGRPDVQGSACTSGCAQQVRITSELPDYARNAHGNLALQFRRIGPKGAVDTESHTGAAGRMAPAPVAPAAELLSRNACLSCHHPANRVVGPSFAEVGARHGGRSDAEAYLTRKILDGGSGVWGSTPMPPQPLLSEGDAQQIARWILGGARQ